MTFIKLLPLLLLLPVVTTSAQQASSLERFSSRKKRRVRGQRHANKPERRRLKHDPNQRVSQQIFDKLRNLKDSEDVYEELDEPYRPSEKGKGSGNNFKRNREGASKFEHLTSKSAKLPSQEGEMDSGEGAGDGGGAGDGEGEMDSGEGAGDGGGAGDGEGAGDGGGDGDSDDGRLEPDGFDFTDCDSFSLAWLIELAISCVEDGDNLINCECPTSENLLTIGRLTCATQEERFVNPPACPFKCPVCEFCMVLNGCEDIYDTSFRR